MATTVLIPTPLRAYTGKRDSVQVEGATIGDALRDLTKQFGELKQHLYTEQGALRSFVNIYVNDDDIRYLQKDATTLKPGDVVSIVPSVAGGVGSVGTEPEAATARELPQLTNDEIKRYSRHLIMP